MEEQKKKSFIGQIPIIEGFAAGGYFQIMPIRLPPDDRHEPEMDRKEEISISEEDTGQFLYYFLDGLFDDDCPNSYLRPDNSTNFEWYDHNIYTYEAVENMLSDIEHYAHLLKTNFDDPKLNDLKKWFEPSSFYPGENYRQKDWTAEENEMLIRENIWIAVDFYERFVSRMRKMMEAAKDYELITFWGP